MVLTEAGGVVAAGAAGVGVELFSYNRSNFKYDREMRQRNELGLLNFRIQQAGLWREDVRDIIGMTEQKMDKYLVVAILELGMCAGFFCKGRLEPGVPPWLVTLYLLSLVGSFVYLLMSVLFAMHAAVVANCTAVRLTTQFVRLPIPNWEQVEEIRTYASAFETLPLSGMLRVPFLGRRSRQSPLPENDEDCRSFSRSGIPDRPSATADPWGLERLGHKRNLSELQPMDPALRMHVELARRASSQYQCFDAFARVSMSFGTNQLTNTVLFFVLGIIAWQDGAVWPAICIALLMTGAQFACIRGDCPLSLWQQLLACAILLVGKPLAAVLVADQVLDRSHQHTAIMDLSIFLPIACLSQAAWLFWTMRLLEIRKQDNGIVLPTRFRNVLYLDVFGWLQHSRHSALDSKEHLNQTEADHLPTRKTAVQSPPMSTIRQSSVCPRRSDDSSVSTAAPVTSESEFGGLLSIWSTAPTERTTESGIDSFPEESEPEASEPEPEYTGLLESCDQDQEHTNSKIPLCSLGVLLEDGPGDDRHWELHDGLVTTNSSSLPRVASVNGPRVPSSLHEAPRDVFDPHSFAPDPTDAEIFGAAAAAAEIARLHPGRWPAQTFHSATLLMVFFWSLGVLFLIPSFRELQMKPRVEELLLEVEEKYHRHHGGRMPSAGYIGTDPNGNPMFIPTVHERPHMLEGGERLNVKFPTNEGFFPRALSADRDGQQLVITGDIGVYMAVGVAPVIVDSSDSGFSAKRRLSDDIKFASEEAASTMEALTFHSVQPCSGLEGQAIRDANLVCDGHSDKLDCRIFVLIANGPQILECPVKKTHEDGQDQISMQNSDAPYNVAWTISKSWLYRNHVEHVDSLAIDKACLQRHEHSGVGRSRHFLDTQDTGCIIVGTGAINHGRSYGRIVQLKEKYTDRWTLIPERSINVHNSQIIQGALHVLDSGYVLALKAHHDEKHRNNLFTTIEVFSKYSGKMLDVWQLPGQLNWVALAGSATHLLAIGVRQDPWRFELWRFPIPDRLLRPAQQS